jgi:hypothetical protein
MHRQLLANYKSQLGLLQGAHENLKRIRSAWFSYFCPARIRHSFHGNQLLTIICASVRGAPEFSFTALHCSPTPFQRQKGLKRVRKIQRGTGSHPSEPLVCLPSVFLNEVVNSSGQSQPVPRALIAPSFSDRKSSLRLEPAGSPPSRSPPPPRPAAAPPEPEQTARQSPPRNGQTGTRAGSQSRRGGTGAPSKVTAGAAGRRP